jgi:hypothetical protein
VDLTGIEPMTSSMPSNGRYLRAKCGQNYNQVAKGPIVWNQPNNTSALHSVSPFGN